MIKQFLCNYGFEKNDNKLHETWIFNKLLFYCFRAVAALFGIAIYICWIVKK